MTRRRPQYLEAQGAGFRDRWLLSYTDVVTILLILFVSVAAQGLKAHIAQAPAAAPKPAPVTPPVKAVAVDPRARLLWMQQKLARPGWDVRMEPRGLVISIPQSVLFASGDARVSAQALPALAQIAEVIGKTNNQIALVGHADTVPIHNRQFRDNWDLSAARSLSLLELLTRRYAISEQRLSIQGYGSNVPLDSNQTESGRAANRRVEILILDN